MLRYNISYGLLGAISAIAPIFSFFLIRYKWDIDLVGMYTYATSIMVLIAMLPSITRNSIERFVPTLSGLEKRRFSEFMLFSQNVALVFIFCVLLIIFFVFNSKQEYMMMVVFFQMTYNSYLNSIVIYLKSIDKLSKASFYRIVFTYCYQLFFCLSIILFGSSLSYLILNAIILILLLYSFGKNEVNIFCCFTTLENIRKYYKYFLDGGMLLLFTVGNQLLMQLDVLILKNISDYSSIAIYGFSCQVFVYLTFFPTIYISSYTAEIFKNKGDNGVLKKISMMILKPLSFYFIVIILFVGYLFGFFVTKFFPQYFQSVDFVRILTLAMPFFVLYNFLSLYLIAKRDYRFLLAVTSIVVLFSFLIKGFLYNKYMLSGLAFSNIPIFIILCFFLIFRIYMKNKGKE